MSNLKLIESLKVKATFIANERAVMAYELELIDQQLKAIADLNFIPSFDDDYWELEETKEIGKNFSIDENLEQNSDNRLCVLDNGLMDRFYKELTCIFKKEGAK